MFIMKRNTAHKPQVKCKLIPFYKITVSTINTCDICCKNVVTQKYLQCVYIIYNREREREIVGNVCTNEKTTLT